jgi:uncharacterized caspase-like protein
LPLKYSNGKWAHDTAQARLAILAAPAPTSAVPVPPRAPPAVAAPANAKPAAVATVPTPSPSSPAIISPSGPVGEKLALVIGNGAYRNAPTLPNPPNDARAIAKALRDNGFQVIEGTDLDRVSMERALLEFLQKAPAAKVRLLFYAGHGMQVDGNNYLVPIDATVASKGTALYELVDVDRLLKGLDDESHANVIILDACRDNPFESHISSGRSVGRSSGLSGYESVGSGTLIAFATAPGNTKSQ